MYPDYIESVLQDYHEKKAANDLPFDMTQLKPAKFKAACLAMCRKRYMRKDERVLTAFFGEGSDEEVCLQAINRCDIDKFRPLINYLKGTVRTTDDKNIELLAWMIDFRGRPWHIKWKPNTNSSEDSGDRPKEREGEAIVGTDQDGLKKFDPDLESKPTGTHPSTQSFPRPKTKKTIAVIIIFAVLVFGGYWLRNNKSPKFAPTGHEGCMFWDEDHYQPISCKPHGDTLVVALDSNKLLHFRKITQPDTITPNAIGSVWYVKYRKGYEFYTGDGFHPIDPNLRLRPITEFIIRNHVPPEQ